MAEKKRSLWDLFSMVEGGRLKSTFLMYSFALSFVFLAVYAAAFAFLIDPIERLFAPLSPWLAAAMACVLPALLGSALCVLCQRIARDKRLAPTAFVWLLIYGLAVLLAVLAAFEPGERGLVLGLLGQLIPLPLALGGGWTWGVALGHARRKGEASAPRRGECE